MAKTRGASFRRPLARCAVRVTVKTLKEVGGTRHSQIQRATLQATLLIEIFVLERVFLEARGACGLCELASFAVVEARIAHIVG
jgi:hypothetical protein